MFEKGDLVRCLRPTWTDSYPNIDHNARWLVVDLDAEGDLWLWHIQYPLESPMLDYSSQYIKVENVHSHGV